MVWNPEWETVFKEQEWGKYPPECLIRFIAANYYKKDRKTVKILELGSGTGANLWFMAREGFDVYGIECSKTAVERSKQRLQSEGLKADITIGDIAVLPYQFSYFDAVVDGDCLYCNSTEDTKSILREVKRVLKKDGLFFSRTPTDKMYIGKLFDKVGDMEYSNIADGPLKGKGLARLLDRARLNRLYGEFFNILTIDKEEESRDNAAVLVSKWLIVCRNNKE